MSQLLLVQRHRPNALEKKGTVPLFVEVGGLSADTLPWLVSSAKENFLWLDTAHTSGVVRAAIKSMALPGEIFLGVLKAITLRGKAEQWENGYPFSLQGVQSAIERLRYYEIPDPEILAAHPAQDQPEWLSEKNLGCPVRFCAWLPPKVVVAIPKDRGFLGSLGYVAQGHYWVVVHNASRGFAFAGNPLE